MVANKSHTLDRTVLYELVWQYPRTELAKQFELSDVAIAKHCKSARIPMPPPGYWVRIKNGSKTAVRPQLPQRLPGQSRTVSLGTNDRYYRSVTDDELFAPMDPPVFGESVEDIVNPAIKRMGKVAFVKDLDNPHAGLNKVLASERRKRESHKASGYSYDKPLFDAPHFQRQLCLVNSLLWGVSRVGGTGHVMKVEEWIQGYGTTYSLHAVLEVGDIGVGIAFDEPSSPKRATRSLYAATTTLRLCARHTQKDSECWTDGPGNRLEKQLTAIAVATLWCAERRLRESAQSHYEWLIKRREEVVAQRARAAEAERRRKLEEMAKRRKDACDALLRMAHNYRQAQDIRFIVETLCANGNSEAVEAGNLQRWREQVLMVADSMDPTRMQLVDVIKQTVHLLEVGDA